MGLPQLQAVAIQKMALNVLEGQVPSLEGRSGVTLARRSGSQPSKCRPCGGPAGSWALHRDVREQTVPE